MLAANAIEAFGVKKALRLLGAKTGVEMFLEQVIQGFAVLAGVQPERLRQAG